MQCAWCQLQPRSTHCAENEQLAGCRGCLGSCVARVDWQECCQSFRGRLPCDDRFTKVTKPNKMSLTLLL